MKLASSVSLSSRAAVAPRPRRSSGAVRPQANTLWQLQPDPAWCKKNESKCKPLATVDLTGNIGRKRVCSIASADFQCNEAIDMCVVDHGGIHLIFEAEGSANPLDSPSTLFVVDVDSTCAVALDGQELRKGTRTQCKPGAVIAMGQEAQYRVERNVFAHA